MPSKTPKQAAFMRAVEHNPDFAAKVGVPQKVGREFAQADQMQAPQPPQAPRLVQMLREDAAKGVKR